MTAHQRFRTTELDVVIVSDHVAAHGLARTLGSRDYAVVVHEPAGLVQIGRPSLLILDLDAVEPDTIPMLIERLDHATTTAAGWSTDALRGVDRTMTLRLDEHFAKTPDLEFLATQVELSLRRSLRLREVSPLTGLPGNTHIQRELVARTATDEPTAVIHSDLDHFKAFNDHYGFVRGDAVINFCADCLKQGMAAGGDADGFLGHIGGDDFVIIVAAGTAEKTCQVAINAWEDGIADFYDPADRARGWIEATDRHGDVLSFPPASLSLGVATNLNAPFGTPWRAAAIAAEMKEYAKRQPGSNFQVDRRT